MSAALPEKKTAALSFSAETKAELCREKPENRPCAVAECYGVLLYCNSFTFQGIRIITASRDFVRRLPRLFRRAFSLDFDVCPETLKDGKNSLLITQREKLERIFAAFGSGTSGPLNHHINLGVLEEEGCREAFIRGAFLAGGSVTDPEKGYHLELATSHKSVNREMFSLLLDLNLDPGESSRGMSDLLYFKQADAIADFLTTAGAPIAAMKVMTAKVERSMRNDITRKTNCDMANADRVVAAAQEQLEAIRRIALEYGLDSLPDTLRDTALLRLANPEASLSELALLSYPKVTKSCLSYRIKKLVNYKGGE